MKSIIICVCVIIFSVSAWADKELPSGDLTLEQAIAITLEQNPGMAEARERINQAKAVLIQAKSAWLPRISVQGSAMAMDVTIQPDWKPDLRLSESLNEYKGEIQGSFLLFEGFARHAKIAGATHGLAKSEYMQQNTRRLLIKAVTLTYYRARISMEKMQIARQDQEFNRILEAHARIRHEAGVSPESEVLNFSVRALTAETNFLDAKKEFQTTCLTLAQLMGVGELSLSPAHIPSAKDLPAHLEQPDPESEISFAMTHRPDIKALDMGIAALKRQYEASKAGIFPKIAMVSGVKYLYQDDKAPIDEEEHQTYAGVSLQWDLFTGGQRKGEIGEAYARLQEVTAQRNNLSLSLRADIQKAVVSTDTAWNNWQNRKNIAYMANTVRDHVQKAYKAGK
ncbi:MAG: hypothetical protein CSB32_01890, partial [Desulfobacterales bacterium]